MNNLLSWFKTYGTTIGLLGLAVYYLSTGKYEQAMATFAAALAAAGILQTANSIPQKAAAQMVEQLRLAQTEKK